MSKWGEIQQPLVIKHGLLEHAPFSSMIVQLKKDAQLAMFDDTLVPPAICWWNPSEFPNFHQVLKGWVGEEKGFDPLGVTDALPVYWVREAEPRVMGYEWNILEEWSFEWENKGFTMGFILYTWWYNWCINGRVMG